MFAVCGAGSLAAAVGLVWWLLPREAPRPRIAGAALVEWRASPMMEGEGELVRSITATAPGLPPGSSGTEVPDLVPDLQGAAGSGTGERIGTAAPAPPVILIHHRAGSAAGREAARRIAAEARRIGFEVIGIRAEPAVPTMREVRYPGGGAALEAERLAARLRNRWGNAWRVQTGDGPALGRDRDGAEPRSAASVLEVWLPHR